MLAIAWQRSSCTRPLEHSSPMQVEEPRCSLSPHNKELPWLEGFLNMRLRNPAAEGSSPYHKSHHKRLSTTKMQARQLITVNTSRGCW